MNDAASIAAMCLMSAPAAKNRSTAEDTTRTFTSPAASAASSAACSPSSSGPLSALAGGEAIVTRQIPGRGRLPGHDVLRLAHRHLPFHEVSYRTGYRSRPG